MCLYASVSLFLLLQTAIPVPSPVTGVIEELLVPDGETVVAGTELCKIKITGRFVAKEHLFAMASYQ